MSANPYRGYRPIQIPPQRERKDYNFLTEITIPSVQAMIVTWLCSGVLGLLLYLCVYAGPQNISTLLSLAILVGTAYVAGFARISYDAKAPALALGALLFAVQQYGFTKLAEVWPWDWREPLTMWHNWAHTLWFGPLVGGGSLIWRFVNEILDPFWPRLKQYPEPPKPQRQPRLTDRKMVITRYPNDSQEVEVEPEVIEEVWIPPEREIPIKGHLIEFVKGCAKRGTARVDWLPKGQKHRLATGLRVTRGVYDDLMRTLRGMDIFGWDGDGTGLEWLCTPEEALKLIRRMVDD